MHKVTNNHVSGSCWLFLVIIDDFRRQLVIFGDKGRFLVFICNFVTKWRYILCYLLLFVACSDILLTFLYDLSLNECKYWTRISIKGVISIFQRKKPSKWWPNVVMAKDVSHTFNATSVNLMARTVFFLWNSSSPSWATMGRILTILPTVWWVKMAIKVKNGKIWP